MTWTALFFVAVASVNSGVTLTYSNYPQFSNCLNCEPQKTTPAILGEYPSADLCVKELREFLKKNSSVSGRGICQSGDINGD